MKIIDKFLKVLNTDRNTFVTYILTLFTVYFVIDRIVELLFMFFTGISVSYWGPLKYTFALACPVFAFYFSFASKFIKSEENKISFLYIYIIALYIIGISMAVQWINRLCWLLFAFVPNYADIVTKFPDLVGPAFKALAVYLPAVTFYPLFKWIYTGLNDSKDITDSIMDYGGISLTNDKSGTGPYTCEMPLCKDKDKGNIVKIPENRRFEVALIVGISGSGKTSMMFEPMIARDLEKKYFFKEVSKEMGFTALKTGLATLNCPYTNEYINKNFSLNMLTPNENKEKVYKTYMNNLIYNYAGENTVYKNLGLTSISPDYETIQNTTQVARNFNIPFNIVDPNNPDSIGINPFVHDNPSKTAIVISSVLRGMYKATHTDMDEVYKENAAIQAIENLSILLKEMYPRLHDGLLPNLEDMLKMLSNFDLVEDMCNAMINEEDLAEQYSIQIAYFKRHFYRTGSARPETEKNVFAFITQLDNLLRYPGIKNILCNRNYNINFDNALANGEVTFVCTRRGDLGETAHNAFGLFFILLMQYSVLSRPGNEKTRVPHFLYIDEFASFVSEATTPIFTLYRKYRVGAVISAQSLAQFGENEGDNYRQIILGNSTTKVVFGNNTPEENRWWQTEFGTHREWKFKNDYNTAKGEYDQKLGGIEWGWKEYFKDGKIQTMKFKNCAYKTKDVKGKLVIGQGVVDFLESKYKEPKEEKVFKFTKYNKGIHEEETKPKKKKFNPKAIDFNKYENDEVDPIQTDTTDSQYLLNNEDAISFNLKNNSNSDN